MTVALMWEARAVEGRGAELLAWAAGQPLDPAPLRRETFRAPEDRVLVITWWDGRTTPDLPELPEPDRTWCAGPCTGGASSRSDNRFRDDRGRVPAGFLQATEE